MGEQPTTRQEETRPESEPVQASERTEELGRTDEPDTFPREYVEKLRKENAEARTKAKRAETLQQKLLEATIKMAVDGILADPTDLAVSDDLYDGEGFPDVDKIVVAAKDLVARKPHLGDRRSTGDVGQGAREEPQQVNLAAMLRERAG